MPQIEVCYKCSMSSLELGSEVLGVETAAEERACQDMCLLLEGCTVYRWRMDRNLICLVSTLPYSQLVE